jgi:hypothetical protein
MKSRIILFAVALVAGMWACAGAQVVTFNSPSPWMSLREEDVVAKTLLDTAKLEKKPVTFTLFKIENGEKKKLASLSQIAKDYSQEFKLLQLKDKILGGRDYLTIEWSVKGKDDKGSLEPFGVAIVSPSPDTIAVGGFVESGVTLEKAKALKDDQLIKVGDNSFGIIWDKKLLGLVCKKGPAKESLTFVFDGKNGKNAFLSYPDRFVSYLPESDSVFARHYTRSVSDSGIVYTESKWNNEITKAADNQVAIILVPWHDTGIIPWDGRIIGFAVFSGEQSTLPSGAQDRIPGTWADLVLKGGPPEPKN